MTQRAANTTPAARPATVTLAPPDTVVELVLFQPLVHERALEHVNGPVPVGTRGPHAAVAFPACP